jgi:hypothetical protein
MKPCRRTRYDPTQAHRLPEYRNPTDNSRLRGWTIEPRHIEEVESVVSCGLELSMEDRYDLIAAARLAGLSAAFINELHDSTVVPLWWRQAAKAKKRP